MSVVKAAVNERAFNAPLKWFAGQQKAGGWSKKRNRGNNGSNNIRMT